ncbi:uncharacterized protein LOC141692676 [Apium graveolens]|uniref:uncharacterized protein LOC141692676 n=1 Tax=Apium graveolens TaxID=4045 RepID=UPI003D7B1E7F
MGFRCFRDFNVVILGKQAWRLITVPDSLVTQIYRARYFPEASLFYAKIGHNPSFIWRSIWEARDLIMTGIRWRIASGENINVMGQPWLNDEVNPFVETNHQGLKGHKIFSLFCLDREVCDGDVIRDMFNERDQECIFNTHVEDSIIEMWFFGEKKVQDRKAKIICVCWSIWKARNGIVWNKKPTSVNRVVALAKQHLYQWKTSQNCSTNALLQPVYEGDGACIWVKPQRKSTKLTVDAAVFKTEEEVTIGMVARDCNGDLLDAQTRVYKGLKSAEWTEAMAVKEALSWCDRVD